MHNPVKTAHYTPSKRTVLEPLAYTSRHRRVPEFEDEDEAIDTDTGTDKDAWSVFLGS